MPQVWTCHGPTSSTSQNYCNGGTCTKVGYGAKERIVSVTIRFEVRKESIQDRRVGLGDVFWVSI